MGELHIEIIHDRIKREYNIETHLGPLQVAYRETILQSATATGEASANFPRVLYDSLPLWKSLLLFRTISQWQAICFVCLLYCFMVQCDLWLQ